MLCKKVSEREWERIKVSFYKTLSNRQANGKKGDRTRIIRAQIRVYFENRDQFEQDLAEQDDELLASDAASLGLEETNSSQISVQSREDKFVESALGLQKNAARTKPISYVEHALDELSKLDRTGISIMKPDEKADFFKKLDILVQRAQKFTKDKFE